ncbi:MAG: hypothetical protein N2315_09420, partial [Thermanaerothrix sp.]|nr:hypothetical protein [Thermanaerothrix sp.]
MQSLVLGITVLMYGLIIIFPEKKAFIAMAAALIMMALGVVSPQEAFTKMVNWNVLMIFVGSLV